MAKEKTALFIDGSNFYAAARALNMDIDYAKLHSFFSADVNLIRAYYYTCLLYTSPSPRDATLSRMPSSA